MQFKPELMREILLYLETVPAGNVFNGLLQVEGYSQEEVNQHMMILNDDGYFMGAVVARDGRAMPRAFMIQGLSMKSHEFLANSRNNTVWKKVLAKAQSEGASTGMTVLNSLLSAAAKKYAGIE